MGLCKEPNDRHEAKMNLDGGVPVGREGAAAVLATSLDSQTDTAVWPNTVTLKLEHPHSAAGRQRQKRRDDADAYLLET